MGENMNESDMNIAKALDIEIPNEEPKDRPKPIQLASVESATGAYKPSDADDDYKEVRRNLKVIIEQSNSAIQGILELAEDSQQPRAYEVVAQLIGQTLEANTKLVDLHRRMKDIKRIESGSTPTTVTNNSIFVGSTTELQKLIRNQRQIIDANTEQKKDKS
jgi:ferritin-like protein